MSAEQRAAELRAQLVHGRARRDRPLAEGAEEVGGVPGDGAQEIAVVDGASLLLAARPESSASATLRQLPGRRFRAPPLFGST